jgi:hypothetical protein
MNDESKDVPLYVLKYESRRQYFIILLLLIPSLYALFNLFEITIQMSAPQDKIGNLCVLMGITAIWFTFFLTEIILTREIRFYKDCVIKIWYFLGSKKVLLDRASMTVSSISKWSRRTILPKNKPWSFLKTVSWEEILVSDEDKKDLDKMLIMLCNRNIDELNKQGTIVDLVNPVKENNGVHISKC